jgi:hypothetical protein
LSAAETGIEAAVRVARPRIMAERKKGAALSEDLVKTKIFVFEAEDMQGGFAFRSGARRSFSFAGWQRFAQAREDVE